METNRNPNRTGENWDAFMAQFKLRDIIDAPGGGWTVQSASGSTYHVASKPCLDEMGSMYFRWTCSCPARGRCRHIDAVEQMRHAEEAAEGDTDGLDLLERTA